jgi:hypothetical protein
MSQIDRISPSFVGEDKISLEVDEASLPLQVFKPLTVNISYTNVGTAGISLPLELTIQPGFGSGGEANGFFQKIFRRDAPISFSYRPPAAGVYLLLLKEIHHNRWQGRLKIEVAGDKFTEAIERSRT